MKIKTSKNITYQTHNLLRCFSFNHSYSIFITDYDVIFNQEITLYPNKL